MKLWAFFKKKLQMRPLTASVEACCPKAAAQVKALAERLKALQAQNIKLAVDRCEQAKKATTSVSPVLRLKQGRSWSQV